jgi:hypothetical protein
MPDAPREAVTGRFAVMQRMVRITLPSRRLWRQYLDFHIFIGLLVDTVPERCYIYYMRNVYTLKGTRK